MVFKEKNVERILLSAKELFEDAYGSIDNSVFMLSPFSLILMGDHTHYNDGMLLTCNVDRYSVIVLRARRDNKFLIRTNDYPDVVELDKFELTNENKNSILKFAKSVLDEFKQREINLTGFECAIFTNVPAGLGLGRAASIQLGLVKAINKEFKLKLGKPGKVNISFAANKKITGKISNKANHCSVCLGKEKRIMLVDLRNDKPKYFSVPEEDYRLVVCNTNEKIDNPQKVCNERISECSVGVKGLRLYIWGIKNLRDISIEFLKKHKHVLPQSLYKRCYYYVKEKMRVSESLTFLRKNNFNEFGKMIFESHKSLSEEYEISSTKIDYLVDCASKIDGVLGSKIICCSDYESTYNIVKADKVEEFKAKIKSCYKKYQDKEISILTLNLTDGIKKVPKNVISDL